MARYISEVVDLNRLRKDQLNLIVSGCGTGKSHLVSRKLFEHFPDLKPEEVLFVTSRSITARQHAEEYGQILFDKADKQVINFWSGAADAMSDNNHGGVRVMTYDKISYLLKYTGSADHYCFEKVRVVVLDEIHSLFTDSFCRHTDAVLVWLKLYVTMKKYYFIGMTATESCIKEATAAYGIGVNHLLDEPLFRYKAKQLVCTDFKSIPLVLKKSKGKTIVLCNSLKNCEILHAAIPNSAIVISDNNREYTKEMDAIRQHIIRYSTLPDKVTEAVAWDKKGEPTKYKTHPLDVLIVTTAMREGYSLLPARGVKNVVCCIPDSLHVILFVGRARYDIDNVIVANGTIGAIKDEKGLRAERKLFAEFFDMKSDEWWAYVKNAFGCSVESVCRVRYRSELGNQKLSGPVPDVERFVEYINKTYLQLGDELDKDRFIEKRNREKIIDKFCECRLNVKKREDTTFQYVTQVMRDSLGYEVLRKVRRVPDECTTEVYNVVSKFDREAVWMPHVYINSKTKEGTEADYNLLG